MNQTVALNILPTDVVSLRRKEKNRVGKIFALATDGERLRLKYLYTRAQSLAGRQWWKHAECETTDRGLEESAKLLAEYRILLANIAHRGNFYGK